jgi:hypothetical protein
VTLYKASWQGQIPYKAKFRIQPRRSLKYGGEESLCDNVQCTVLAKSNFYYNGSMYCKRKGKMYDYEECKSDAAFEGCCSNEI